MLIIVVHDMTLFFMGTLVAEWGADRERSMPRVLTAMLWSLIRRPITACLILGLGLNLAGIGLPKALLNSIQLLGQAGIPTALLVLGLKSVGATRPEYPGRMALVLALKLIIFPLLVGACGFMVFQLPFTQAAALMVGAAMPVGISALIFSAGVGVLERESASAIVWSNVCFLVTFPLVTWVLFAMK